MVRVKKSKKSDNGKPKKSDIIKECLKYWSLIVRQRDGYQCQVDPENSKTVQAHHIFPKKHYPSVMFDIDNGITLSAGKHIYFAESNHEAFRDFVIQWMGKRQYEKLKDRANRKESYTIADLLDIRDKLKRMVDR